MLGMLIAYDDDGNVIATLDYMVARDDDGDVVGLIDFEAHERSGGRLRDVWDVEGAAGSCTWPEWIGGQAHQFRVELDGQKRASALVHRQSGHRRERAAIETALGEVGEARRDARRLVGAPDRPLRLDDAGRTGRPDKLPPQRTLPLDGLAP